MITVAGGSEEYLSWAVFAALVVSGLGELAHDHRSKRVRSRPW